MITHTPTDREIAADWRRALRIRAMIGAALTAWVLVLTVTWPVIAR